jgi:hypothetical protein
MSADEIADLQDESEWDFELAVRQRAPQGHRAIVAVSFTTAEFTLLSEAAELHGQSLTQFIGEAALKQVRSEQ